MNPRVVDRWDPALPAALEEVLQSGGVLVFPTDTVPGLGGDPWDRRALARVRAMKGRGEDQPFTLHVGPLAAVGRYALVDAKATALLGRLLPGPYTVLLWAKDEAPPCAVSEGKVGLRVPRHSFFSGLMRELGRPLFGTSANRVGLPPLTDVDRILEAFPRVDLVITGESGSGEPSAILDLTADPPVARRGSLPQGL